MATATRNTSGTDTDTSKALTSFGASFATVSTANSSSASSSSSSFSSTTSFADEASHADTATRRVSFQTAFFADSSSSLSLDDIVEADDEADHTRKHHTKEDLQAGSSSLPLASLNEASADAEEDTLGEEQRQAKRRTPFLLKPRKKELHHFVIAAEMEAELDDSDSDDDDEFDDDNDEVFGRQS